MDRQTLLENAGIKISSDVPDFCAKNFGNKTAFSFMKGKELKTVTFSRLKLEADSIGSLLFKLGLGKKRIAILAENSVEWIEAFFAIERVGSIAVPLDKELYNDDIIKLIKRSDCKAVFYSKSYQSKVDDIKNDFTQISFISFESFPEIIEKEKNNAVLLPKFEIDENDPCLIVFTSGTTGDSKGVVLSHKNILSDTIIGCRILGNFKKAVLILPLHHTFGLITGIIGPMLIEGNVFISKSIRRVQKDMEFFKPDIILVVPIIAETVYKKVWAQAEAQGKAEKLKRGLRLSNFLLKFGIDKRRQLFKEVLSKFGGELNTIICGGAPINENIVKGLCELGIETRNGYGITECSPIVSVNPFGKGKNKIGSAGVALDCCEIRIKDKDKDGIGEIEVRGSNVMLGYLDNEEATKEAFDGEWFKTGDVGRLDKDGYLYLTGRKKNLIILSNGKNVSPEEIEAKLLDFSLIEEVVVFDEDGKIGAEIYPGEGCSDDMKNDIYAVVDEYNKTVPPYKNIEKITVRNTPFPKTTTMKIKRNI